MLTKKFISLSLFLGLTTLSLNAATTMCFKESHQNISTIESVKLSGGECRGNRSVEDMKKEGWNVKDVTVENASEGKNYIYIFTRDDSLAYNEELLLEKMQKKIDESNKKKREEEKRKIKARYVAEGKAIYTSKCQKCHGEKANEPYATARALSTLSEKDMHIAIIGYVNGGYDRGTAFVMQTISQGITEDMVSKVHSYIQSINQPKEEEK